MLGTPRYRLDLGRRVFDSDSDRFSRWHTTWRMFAAFHVLRPGARRGAPRRRRRAAVRRSRRRVSRGRRSSSDRARARAARTTCSVRRSSIPRRATDSTLRSFRDLRARAAAPRRLRSPRAHAACVCRSFDRVAGTADAERRRSHGAARRARHVLRRRELAADRAVHVQARDAAAQRAAVTPFVVGARDARIVAVDVDLAYVLPRYQRRRPALHVMPVLSARGSAAVRGRPVRSPATRPPEASAPTTNRAPSTRRCRARTSAGSSTGFRASHVARIAPGERLAPDHGRRTGARLKLGSHANFPTTSSRMTRRRRPRLRCSTCSRTAARTSCCATRARPRSCCRKAAHGSRVLRAARSRTADRDNIFNATGALRDDVLVQPPRVGDRPHREIHALVSGGNVQPAVSACTFSHRRAARARISRTTRRTSSRTARASSASSALARTPSGSSSTSASPPRQHRSSGSSTLCRARRARRLSLTTSMRRIRRRRRARSTRGRGGVVAPARTVAGAIATASRLASHGGRATSRRRRGRPTAATARCGSSSHRADGGA